MKGIIFVYRTKGIEPRLLTKMNAQLFGKEQQSNFGKYTYKIEGLVPQGEYIRPIRAVIIVKKHHSGEIKNTFDKYGIVYRSFKIELENDDFKNQEFF